MRICDIVRLQPLCKISQYLVYPNGNSLPVVENCISGEHRLLDKEFCAKLNLRVFEFNIDQLSYPSILYDPFTRIAKTTTGFVKMSSSFSRIDYEEAKLQGFQFDRTTQISLPCDQEALRYLLKEGPEKFNELTKVPLKQETRSFAPLSYSSSEAGSDLALKLKRYFSTFKNEDVISLNEVVKKKYLHEIEHLGIKLVRTGAHYEIMLKDFSFKFDQVAESLWGILILLYSNYISDNLVVKKSLLKPEVSYLALNDFLSETCGSGVLSNSELRELIEDEAPREIDGILYYRNQWGRIACRSLFDNSFFQFDFPSIKSAYQKNRFPIDYDTYTLRIGGRILEMSESDRLLYHYICSYLKGVKDE